MIAPKFLNKMTSRKEQQEWLAAIFGRGLEREVLEKTAAAEMYHVIVLHSEEQEVEAKDSIEKVRLFVNEKLSPDDIQKLESNHDLDHHL